MNSLRSIFSLFKVKEKHPYVKLKKEVEVLAPFLIDRKIENIYLKDFLESNLKEYDFFNLGNDFVLYFDKDMNTETDRYIRDHYLEIRERLKSKGRDFVYFPVLIEQLNLEISPALKTTFPFFTDSFTDSILSVLQNSEFNIESGLIEFLEFIKYNGEIKKGCVSGNSGFTILEQNEDESIEDFIEGYIQNLPVYAKDLIFYNINEEEYEKNKNSVKKESLETLQTIKEQIEILRENGQLALLAPKIYKFLQNRIEGIVYTNVEPILVTEDFKILIPKYNNLEIKLSHLTKSIYLLFLSSPEPIDLKDLHHHKDRLFFIYKQVSNQLSHDKMTESIEELLKPNSEAIYVHFSRIKSVFHTHFSEYVGFLYCIMGEKGKPKTIMIDREKIVLQCNLFQLQGCNTYN
jgi:hypothetical protein